MAEPSTSTFIVAGAAAALLGPVLGPAAMIVFGAVAGSMLAMSKVETTTRWGGLRFVLVGVLIALAIAGSAAWAAEKYLEIPGNVALMPVAALIGYARNAIGSLMDKIVELAGSLLSSIVSRGGKS